MGDVLIRPARLADHEAIWRLLEPVIRAGETYALDRDMGREAALGYWMTPGNAVHVAADADEVVGTYYLRANQGGGGRHVANCGYVTARGQEGRGIARTMAEHSLALARTSGFTAMQFNFVVATNARAIRLWQSLGFEIVGRLPGAFVHPLDGVVDSLVMYQTFANR